MRNPAEQLKADIMMVGTRGNESSSTVLMVDKRATAEPTPNTVIIRKNSTENNCKQERIKFKTDDC